MKRYVVLEKEVGETPLQCVERWQKQHSEYQGVPLAYAGRLDPMASGKLLVLIGEECKRQANYHGLDKEYKVEVLLGISSDSGDVLGITKEDRANVTIGTPDILNVLKKLTGKVAFPYPAFSSKTVAGKPLHTWTLEGKLDQITIPSYSATIYSQQLLSVQKISRQALVAAALKKIELLPPVTDPKKSIGNDFRRPQVRQAWKNFSVAGAASDNFPIITIRCRTQAGVYMRTLADEIGKQIGTRGLALSIHRSKIGSYLPLFFGYGVWWKRY